MYYNIVVWLRIENHTESHVRPQNMVLSWEKHVFLTKSWIRVRASASPRGEKNISNQSQNTCSGKKPRKVVSGRQSDSDSLTFVVSTCK